MGAVVLASNYLVQFPIKHYGPVSYTHLRAHETS